MRLTKFLGLLILIITCWTSINAQIFICVDGNGQRHYSDKRCPTSKGQKTESFSEKGKIVPPKSVTVFTAAIKLVKQSFALLTIYEPTNDTYQSLYQRSLQIELKHQRFISSPNRRKFNRYNPFGMDLQTRIITNLSEACRVKSYMTICSTLEGNPWIATLENEYSSQTTEASHDVNKEQRDKLCKKATNAHSGGVISNSMLAYFCKTQST